MKATDLRIGNYVNFKEWNEMCAAKILTITNFRKYYFCYLQYNRKSLHLIGGFTGYYVYELQPIPLTEEWLINFGFVKSQRECNQVNNDSYVKNNLHLIWYNSENENFMQFFVNNKGINVECVHQLQNLYFALTGEELKIAEL